MQEHLEKFPAHTMNTSVQQVDSEIQNIFQKLHETSANIDLINGKEESHIQTEDLKDRHCGYLKSMKNLPFHLKQIITTQHIKRSKVKSLSEAMSVWDFLSSPLNTGNLQEFFKDLNTLMLNLKSVSKYLKFVSKCESNHTDSNQMFIDDSLGNFIGLPKGSYSLPNIQSEYEIEEVSNVRDLNSIKESKVSTKENLKKHYSPIHLNNFDPEPSKVDLLLSFSMEESIMCDENQAALESVDGLVSEKLCTMSDHLESEDLKDRYCGYLKSKKNLQFHFNQILMTHDLKGSSLVKSLSETISVWDLLSSPLETGNLQAFSKELNTLMLNLKSVSKYLIFVSKCESNPTDSNQMFIDDSLRNLIGLLKGSYSLQNIQSEYLIFYDFLLSSSMEESIICDENQAAHYDKTS